MSLWFSLLIPVTYLALLLLPMGAIHLWRKRLQARRRSPLNQMLLRGAGETLRNEAENARIELLLYIVLLPILPLLIYALHISQSYFGGVKETPFRIWVDVSICLAAMAYAIYKIVSLLKWVHKLNLGYEGEVAIAQELNQLMLGGGRVFHDFPAEGFNIDHVVVLPGGVYAVETKGRMKPRRDRGKDDAKVVFDGKRLQFPGWVETEPLEQTMRQAKWLSQWLSSAVGNQVTVKPVLALPGWYVDLQARSDVVIINGRNAIAIFGRLPHSQLETEMIERIAHQLEQRCRNVEPEHFGKSPAQSTNTRS